MEIKKLIHLYFDWNIFKYIQNPRNDNDKVFSKFIYSIKDYIFIAYSPFHIIGLMKNFDETKWDYIIKDCGLISEITNNLCIFYDGNNQIHVEVRNPLEMFKEQLKFKSLLENKMKPDNLFQQMTKEQKEEFKKNFIKAKTNKDLKNTNDPIGKIIFNSQNPEDAFKEIISFGMNIQKEPETYKNLRLNLKEQIQIIKDLPESEKVKIRNELKSRGIDKDLMELENDDILSLSKEFLDQKINTDISNNYTFKDIFGITKQENITKKNTFKNIIDDSFHLEMAKYSLYYISEDKENLKKAKLVTAQMNLNTEIFKIEEANRFIKVSLYTIKNENI